MHGFEIEGAVSVNATSLGLNFEIDLGMASDGPGTSPGKISES